MSVETLREKQERNAGIILRERTLILDGGVGHEVKVVDEAGLPGMEEPIPKHIQMFNDDDGFYVQAFRTAVEVNKFIAVLAAARDEAFGKEKS